MHLAVFDYDKDAGNPLKPVGVERYDYYLKNCFEYAIVHSHKYKVYLCDNTRSKNFPLVARF